MSASNLLLALRSMPKGVEVGFAVNDRDGITITARQRTWGVEKTARSLASRVELDHARWPDEMLAQAVRRLSATVHVEVEAWERATEVVSRALHDDGIATIDAFQPYGFGRSRGVSDPRDLERLVAVAGWVREHEGDVGDLTEAWAVFSTYHAAAGLASVESAIRARHILAALRSALESIEPDEPDMNAIGAEERRELDACERRGDRR